MAFPLNKEELFALAVFLSQATDLSPDLSSARSKLQDFFSLQGQPAETVGWSDDHLGLLVSVPP
jgi:hypothetical protein